MESFNKFKKKIMLELLLKSIFISFSVGLFVFSLPLIYIKVKGIEFNIIYLILISIGTLLITFGISYLILKPSRVKIAKRIDSDLNMNQKVQTMVEYEKEENFMIELQRENTLNILAGKPLKSLGMKFSFLIFIVLAISLACCVTAFAIPKYEEPTLPETPEPTYEVDDWTILAIRDIIEEVKESEAKESLKTIYINKLEQLIVELEDNIDKMSQMKEYVLNLINEVLLELDKVNTNNEVYVVLRDSSNSLVSSLAVEINLLDVEDITKLIENIAALISGEDPAGAVEEFNNDFGRPLKSSNLDKKDDLYLALEKLANEVYSTKTASNVVEEVQKVINNNIENIITIINNQAENYRIAHYIEFELKVIFGLEETKTGESEEEEDENHNNPYDDEDDKKDQQQNNSGGLGTGDILFGSNDEFFDPDKGVVIYGDVITSYYGEILGKLNEGTLDEGLREYFERYYDELLGDGELDKE